MKEKKPDSLSIKELERRMRPGVLSQDGFLGEEENLKDVLRKDARKLQKLGITHSQLADRLEALITAAIEIPGRTTRVGEFLVQLKSYEGFQICPWSTDIHHTQCRAGGGVKYASLDWNIRNLESNREMSGPGLAVHLIREHHFFEGFDSPHRVDVRELAQLLNLP